MPYIGNVNAFESVGTSDIEDAAVTAEKIHPSVVLGGPSLGTDSVIRTNANTISEDITIPANTNGMTAGPVSIADGYTITVEGTWSII